MGQILQFIRPERVFDHETIAVLAAAYEQAISALRARGQPEVMREIVARRIIALAAKGERDPERLYAAALAGLRSLKGAAALSPRPAIETLVPPNVGICASTPRDSLRVEPPNGIHAGSFDAGILGAGNRHRE